MYPDPNRCVPSAPFCRAVYEADADGFSVVGAEIFALLSAAHGGQLTVANYLWRSGARLVRHYTRFYAFLGGPFFCEMDGLWRAVIRQAARHVPEGEPIRVRVDETERCLVKDASSAKKRKRYLEVFFTTVLRLGSEQILREYRGRWSVEMR